MNLGPYRPGPCCSAWTLLRRARLQAVQSRAEAARRAPRGRRAAEQRDRAACLERGAGVHVHAALATRRGRHRRLQAQLRAPDRSSHSIWLASRRRGRRRDGRAPRLSAAQACMDVRGLQGVVQRRCRLSLSGLTTVRQASEPSRALTSRRRGRGPGGAPVSCRRRSRQPAPCAGPRAGRPSAAHPGCAPAAAHLHACRTLKPVRALDAGVTARGAGAASLSVCA